MAEAEVAPKPKGKKKFLIIIILLLVVLGGGGGAALYAQNAGLFGGGHEQPEEAEDRPHLVAREGVTEKVIKRYETPKGDGKVDPSKFQATYYPFDGNFTANLKDGEGFVQLGMGVSTYYDEQVLEHLKLHDMAIRSAVILTLSNQDAMMLSTQEGKDQLRDVLRKTINDVLIRKESFGGIDDVYFTSFVTQ